MRTSLRYIIYYILIIFKEQKLQLILKDFGHKNNYKVDQFNYHININNNRYEFKGIFLTTQKRRNVLLIKQQIFSQDYKRGKVAFRLWSN